MGLFFPEENHPKAPGRAVGFARYREVLEGSFGSFFLVSFLAMLGMVPFALGMAYAVLSSSMLAMLAASLAGGAIAGPFMACMYDLILRRLRDDRDDWWYCFKKSLRQNWRASILPGMVQCLLLGLVIFSGALIYWAQAPIPWGTVALLALSSVVVTMILTVWWSQVVLFEQRTGIRLKNCLLFILTNLGRCLGAAALQVGWWVLMFLFLPWSALVLPFLGVWYILFLALFLLYRPLDRAFRIEEQLYERFPERRPVEEETEEEV